MCVHKIENAGEVRTFFPDWWILQGCSYKQLHPFLKNLQERNNLTVTRQKPNNIAMLTIKIIFLTKKQTCMNYNSLPVIALALSCSDPQILHFEKVIVYSFCFTMEDLMQARYGWGLRSITMSLSPETQHHSDLLAKQAVMTHAPLQHNWKKSRLLLKIWRVIKLASLTCLTTGQQ